MSEQLAIPPDTLKGRLARLSGLSRVFGVAALIFAISWLLPARIPGRAILVVLSAIALILLAPVLVFRLVRAATRKAIWRLRNRLLVTYVFIGLVPISLILVLVVLSAYALASQFAVYLATSELDRRIALLDAAASALEQVPDGREEEGLQRIGLTLRTQLPGLQLLMLDKGMKRFPAEGTAGWPPDALQNHSGIVLHDGHHYGCAYRAHEGRRVLAIAPFSSELLEDLVPDLGDIYLLRSENGLQAFEDGPRRSRLPPAVNRFDQEFPWLSLVNVTKWEDSAKAESVLLVRSRPSAVLRVLFNRRADTMEGLLPVVLLSVSFLFLVVTSIAFYIGGSLTRTITLAVHELHEGTQRVMHGDFSQRINIAGKDQLGELGHSFNRMTDHIQQLLAVSKEKERLQSELEIAREVQAQLYPKSIPAVKNLELTAICQPARIVSGDYYDYQKLRDGRVALVMGDVAGKGISAALLMATLQSSLRTQLSGYRPQTVKAAEPANSVALSTSRLVSQINQQLYADTSPEKYATFFLGIFDENTGLLTYTNGGHLPPILLRNGEAQLLEVNGMVVGAFPFAEYESSELQMLSGDLLVCYTDGITEPENSYGEMFGEERLVELLQKNEQRGAKEIVDIVIQAVFDWTGSPELQDDMTLLVARRT